MKTSIELTLEVLPERIVPAVLYWRGSVDSNANNYKNWRNESGEQVTNPPVWTDRIIIDDNSERTMYIHPENQLDVTSINVIMPGPTTLTLDPGDPSNGKGIVYVRGDLNIHGILSTPQQQSNWRTGILEIDSSNPLDPGKVTLDGGVLTYSGGEIDTIEDNSGLVYVIEGGTLKLTASAGKIGAKLFIGRDETGEPLHGTVKLDTPGSMTYFRDATVGISYTGTADLIQGSLKLAGGATGWFENYGQTNVLGDIPSEMYFNNVSGTVEVASQRSLDITGFKTLEDTKKASFVNSGITRLKPDATLKVAERFYQKLGQFVTDDSGALGSTFSVNGNVDIQGGTLQMGTEDNRFGTLSITGSLRFGPTGALNIHVSGTESKNDVVSASSVILVAGCGLGARTTGIPEDLELYAEREFLFVANGVTGMWTGFAATGDFTYWSVDANERKLVWDPTPLPPPGG